MHTIKSGLFPHIWIVGEERSIPWRSQSKRAMISWAAQDATCILVLDEVEEPWGNTWLGKTIIFPTYHVGVVTPRGEKRWYR